MKLNQPPRCDPSVNTTGCCPKFDPQGWDGQELHFKDKPFVRARSRSLMHLPLDMGRVFTRVNRHIDEAHAFSADNFIVLSRDISPWHGEHLFSVCGPVEGEEMTTLSGDFITQVFEGPYRQAHHWCAQMRQSARDHGAEPGTIYFFYTTCPKCAQAYGKNYVVGVATLEAPVQA